MTTASRRTSRKPNAASKAYLIHGTDPNKTKKEKRTKAQQAKAAENEERRTARCAVCLHPRDPRSYPIHPGCHTKPKHITTRRSYIA